MNSIVWGGADYPVTQPFALKIHDGIDIGCPADTPIYAARAGVVERAQTGMLSVRVGNERDFYLHGDRFQVSVGAAVARGQLLMYSGMVQVDPRYPLTGPHLHFEVQNGYSLPGAPPYAEGAPLDPVPVLTASLAGDIAGSHSGGLFMALTDLDQQVLIWRISVALGTNKASDAPADVQPHLAGIVTLPTVVADLAAVKSEVDALKAGSLLGVTKFTGSFTGSTE